MAEESGVCELEGLETQLQSLLSSCVGDDANGEPFCSDFCKLVEEHASRWQLPLPQLRILETALCYFARASTFFASNCDHVQHTISSLALSLFELLLFFDQKDFDQEPLKQFTATFQECHFVLAKYQNVHIHQVEYLVQSGGPWASPTLQAVLSDSCLPHTEVDGYISSELPVFFELRLRYLLSCERVSEAMALAKCCARHPTTGQHLFFTQVYLTWLFKTSQYDPLLKEVADINGKDAVQIICCLERDEKDELLLALSTAFISQQLCRGDMYYLCDLVLMWSNLHHRLNTSKQALLKECHQLMLSATNVQSIFPFIRAILQEVGEEGIQFCVELCANALKSRLPCDVITKTFIYKTIAGLLPSDLEVCRACALLVFFLERTVESYKMVYLLYMHPDQEYHVDDSPIGNHIRFDTLQILKKGLHFDPEFWNLIALRTSCLNLMSGKVVGAALLELMEDKWISKYCTKEPANRSSTSVSYHGGERGELPGAKKRHNKEEKHFKEVTENTSKRLKLSAGKTRLNDHGVRRKGSQKSLPLKESSSGPLRRSFWQLDRIHSNVSLRYEEHRRTTRLSEKNPPKRRIRKPKWLLEDSGTLEENVPMRIQKNALKKRRHLRSCVMKRSEGSQMKNNTKLKPLVNCHLKARENKYQNGFSLDILKPASPPQVILELSLPDNELMASFSDDTCSRPRGFPQVLLYKPTVKPPTSSQPGKTVHRKEVILRARDVTMFIQQLHCYVRRQKGKGNGTNVHSSVSTITRSSVQGSPPKNPPKELCEKAAPEITGWNDPQVTAVATNNRDSRVSEKALKAQNTKVLPRKTSSTTDHAEKSTVDMSAPQITGTVNVTDSQRITQSQSTGNTSQSITCLEDVAGNSSAEADFSTASPSLGAAEVTEALNLHLIPETQTCEEPAVEMKVTIASQSSVLDKVSKGPAVTDVSQTSTAVKTTMEAADKKHSVSVNASVSKTSAARVISSHCRDFAVRGGEQELQTQSSQGEICKESTADSNSIYIMDLVEVPDSKEHLLYKNDTSPERNITLNQRSESQASCNPGNRASVGDISALTLATERRITELSPQRLDPEPEEDKWQAPGNSASKESSGGIKCRGADEAEPTSSSSRPEHEASANTHEENREAGLHDSSSEPETEESKLEYCCTFCTKDFKGSRVVAHAMFHYRRDECMFCGMMFKDDLLAMIHLSDHIEKLKRIKEAQAGKKGQENGVLDTKDTSAKGKTTNMPSQCLRRGRPKKSAVFPKSVSSPDSRPPESRTLRSNEKQAGGTSLHKKQNASKHLNTKATVQRVNGHLVKKEFTSLKKDLDAKEEAVEQQICPETNDGVLNLPSQEDIKMDSSVTSGQAEEEIKDEKKKTQQIPKKTSKQFGKEEKNTDSQEKVCCPMDGCSWFTDLSKNRVALLYHALESHYGEIKPLKLAFRVGNSKCSICMRVLWSFEHFQHHVERHRETPRHPCLHQGCTARFKTGMEMRRHARKHSPLQAMCCLPGCSQLFICLWALNLHEREHYASKSVKNEKTADVETSSKVSEIPVRRKSQSLEDTTVSTAGNRSESVKAAHKLRDEAAHESPSRKNLHDHPVSSSKASQMKKEPKERNEHKDSDVLSLSEEDTSALPAAANLRFRQALRKVQVTNKGLAAPKTHKVSSSLLKHRSNMRHKLKKKQVKANTKGFKRRGRPPKNKVHDENTSAGQKLSNPETLKISAVSMKPEAEKEKSQKMQDEVKTAEKAAANSDSSTSEDRRKRNHVHRKSPSNSLNQPVSSELKTQKSNALKRKKLHKIKSHHTSSNADKSKKNIEKGKVNKKEEKKDSEVPSATKKHEKSKSAESSDDKRNRNVENESSCSVPAENINAVATTEEMQKVKRPKEEAKQLLKTKCQNKKTSSSGSSKVRKNKVLNKVDKKEKRPSKNQKETLKKIKKSKGDVQQHDTDKGATVSMKNSLGEKKKEKEATDAPLESSRPCTPAAGSSKTSVSTAPKENKQNVIEKEKSKKSNGTKTSEVRKSSSKRKDVKDDTLKTVKKICKDHSHQSTAQTSEVQKAAGEISAGTEETTQPETPASTTSGSSEAVNGQVSTEDARSTLCKETLAKYGKRPYMRLPPTAYLDEKYITMPKRRKEMSFFQLPQGCTPPEQARPSAALHRQRCANCFASFSSSEELQSHLKRQNCSKLFGFDSDDEGNS